MKKGQVRSPRNKTLVLSPEERTAFEEKLLLPPYPAIAEIEDKIINDDLFNALAFLPSAFADLIIIDPPYNIDKNFHGNDFRATTDNEYEKYVRTWLPGVLACAKKNASIYVCCDWKSSSVIYSVLREYTNIHNRISWQREKGRGALHNWKNCSEDIWYAVMGKDFYFDVNAVMHKKKVIAPYRVDGEPKDWIETEKGKFRLTYPSNFWDDITVPYWSMSENTEHPTQKPEKLTAKLILASSKPGDCVFDPFAGSGTTAVTAKKLGRHYLCIEQNKEYCLWAEKRLSMAEIDKTIQGYSDGVFLERNIPHTGHIIA